MAADAHKPRFAILRRSSSLAWLVFALGAVLAFLGYEFSTARMEHAARANAEALVGDVVRTVRARVDSSYDVVLGAQGFFRASEDVTRLEFHEFIAGLNLAQRHPGIRSVSYGEVVSAGEKAKLEAKVRADVTLTPAGYPNFRVWPEGERSEYMPILYIEPMIAGFEGGLGIDLLTEQRRESVERARDSGVMEMSRSIVLITDPERLPAFTVRMAVYRKGMPTATIDERRAALNGVVTTVYRVRDLVGDLLTIPALGPVYVKLYEQLKSTDAQGAIPAGTQNVLFEKLPSEPFSAAGSDYFKKDVPMNIGGRGWRLQFRGPLHAFVSPTDRALPWLLLGAGFLMSGLLAGLVGSLASSGERARKLAERMTDDLRRSEGELAEAQRLTQSMIEALPNPIFFKSTDGRYRGVNKAWEEFFGIGRAAFVGKSVYDLYPTDKALAERLDSLDRALWEKPGTQSYEETIPAADGTRRNVVYYKATYIGAGEAVAGLIGTIIDITERKQAERRQSMEHAVTRVLAEATNLADAVPKVIQTICETMGWHYGDRYELDVEAGVLRRREMWCIDTPEIRAFAKSAEHRAVAPDASGTGLVRRTYATRKPVWISDIAAHAGLQRKDLIEKAGLHGAFAFPLTAGGPVLGVMEFFHRDVLEPDAMLIQIAESIGSQIGQFIVRMKAEEAVKFVAMHDALTNLPNRVMFNERLEQAIANAERHGRRLALMFIDLDRFKVINDTLGHESGDLLLREVALRLNESLRTGDIVARLGGDEFVVLLEDVPEVLNLGTVADKLISALTQSFVIAGREVHVTASIGISTYPLDAQDIRSLMRYADIAMYRAKEQGRNTFQFYSEQINVHSVERLTLESELRGALERDELEVHYQPVIDGKSGSVSGMEALVRWQHPSGMLPPAKFISIAEETGLIVPIGAWVLNQACMQQQAWMASGLPRIRIAVNLSPRQFMHRNLIEDMVKMLETARCDPTAIELEITESTIMHNAERAVALMRELNEMGIRIAIDDFGTGYSSLAYLKRFPIHSLKIDRSFVADVPRDPSNTAITQAIMAMAHSLGLNVIAEGVETLEQLQFLQSHGCQEMQGYYFSRPVPLAEATAILVKAAQAAREAVTSGK
ncbi:MAG TPA: EAL domain-containing protein [Burkholderiales bacterium]|nr:EAL domain-containing protein [Burkholderiales bacterium]